MVRWLKEPLAHFLLLGALLFIGYGVVSKGRDTHGGRGRRNAVFWVIQRLADLPTYLSQESAAGSQRNPVSWRAMTRRWISLVPS
jgi:hypothetical protein